MKKVLSLILSLMLLMGIMPGMAAAENLPEETLVVVFPYLNKAPVDIEEVENALSEITLSKINARVKLMPIAYGAWSEQFNLLMTGNEQVDLIVTALTNTSLSAKVSKGYLLELDELLDKYGKGTKEVLGDFVVGGTVNGKTFALPTLRDMATSAGLMIMKSYVDKYNIDISAIHDWSDLTPVLKTIKEGEGDGFYPLFLNAAQYTSLTSVYSDNLGDFLGTLEHGNEESGKIINRFEEPAYRELIELIHSWYEAGYINPDAAVTQILWQEAAKSGTCACWPNNAKPGQDKNQSSMIGQELVLAHIGTDEVNTSGLQTCMWSIAYNTIDAERSMMLLNLMYTDADVFNTMNWGIEGKHYVFTDDGHITFPEGVDNQNCGWYINLGWVLGNQFLSHIWTDYDLNYWEVMSDFNKTAKVSPAAGFAFDSTNVKNEYAACQSVINEYKIAIETGTVDLSKLDEMNEKLYASGLQKILDEKQAQYDAFLAASK